MSTCRPDWHRESGQEGHSRQFVLRPDPKDPSKNVCPPDYAKPYTGMKLAYNVGVGMHAFANNFFAINIEVHDLIFQNNASGRNVVTPQGSAVTDSDLQWTNNWLVGLKLHVFLPAHVKVSH